MGIGWQFAFEQWGDYDNANGLSEITYPISLTNKPFVIITTEGDPAGWDNNINGIAIAGADIVTASNTQANIVEMDNQWWGNQTSRAECTSCYCWNINT